LEIELSEKTSALKESEVLLKECRLKNEEEKNGAISRIAELMEINAQVRRTTSNMISQRFFIAIKVPMSNKRFFFALEDEHV
jgi:hypothetical protein